MSMEAATAKSNDQHESKVRILDAALLVIRSKGYAATTIDDVCRQAGLTKGSFFHHFKSKEELAIAAATHFAMMADGLFSQAPFRQHADPLARFLGYLDFRITILQGELPAFTCLLGTMVQETYGSHPAIRQVCEKYICEHANSLVKDIADAKQIYAKEADWKPGDLAMHTQAVIQGAFILAKATQDAGVAAQSIGQLKKYVELLFQRQAA